MHRLLALLAIACPASALAAPCKAPVQAADLQTTLDAAEGAYGRVDIEAFTAAIEEARGQVVCIEEPISTALAAKLHRIEGLAAFANSAKERAIAAFAAARALEPEYSFPSTVVPPGNPLLKQYTARDPVCEEERLPPPEAGKLRIDGHGGRDRPIDFPVLVQVVDAKGPGDVTAYLWPGDALPYAPGAMRSSAQTGVLAGGVGIAVAGLATFIAGAATRPNIDDSLDAIQRKSVRNDTLMSVGAGIGAVGIAGIGISFALPSKTKAP